MADHVAVARRRREDVKHAVRGGDVAGLLERFAQLRRKRGRGRGRSSFSRHQRLVSTDSGLIACRKERIESHVVDPCLDHDITSAAASED